MKTWILITCLVLLPTIPVKGGEKKTETVDYSRITKIKKIFHEIDNLPFKYKDVIKKQFLLETSHASSEVFRKSNNLFGMRLAGSRITTALYSKSGYAFYKSTKESILDRLIYEASYMRNMNRKEYLNFLDNTYSVGGKNYTKTLLNINLKRYE